jgi:hypothetical protein
MSSAEEWNLGLRVGGALTIIKPGPAPVAEIVLQGRGVRRRRRAAGAGAIAVVAAIGVTIPSLLHAAAHTGQSPGPPARPLTVGRLAPVARNGVIGSGMVDGRSWTVRLAGQRGPVARAAGLPATGRLGTTPVGSAPVTFTGAGTGQERLLAGPVSPAVAYLTMQVTDGPVYRLWPVAWRGHRYIGLVLPRNLAVARFTAYSAHGELAYAIPFPAGGFPLVVTWLRPGARPATALSAGIDSSGNSSYRWWNVQVHMGPWGTCLVQTAGAGQVSCRPTRSYPPNAVIAVLTVAWRGVRAGITGPDVAYIKLRLRNRRTARLPVQHVGGQGFWALSVLRHPGPVASWTAYDPARHPVASGAGPPG